MKVTLDLYQLKNIISDMVQVGYMNAVKCYEPTKDSISRREVARWFVNMNLDTELIRQMEDVGLIKGKRKGSGRNSPIYYSKEEIKQALCTIQMNKYINV